MASTSLLDDLHDDDDVSANPTLLCRLANTMRSVRTAAAAVVVVSKICAVHAFSTGTLAAHPPPVLQTSSSSLVSDASARLDPLLTSFLLRSVRENEDDEDENPAVDTDAHLTFSDASRAMIGLSTWDNCLRKARTPIIEDF